MELIQTKQMEYNNNKYETLRKSCYICSMCKKNKDIKDNAFPTGKEATYIDCQLCYIGNNS